MATGTPEGGGNTTHLSTTHRHGGLVALTTSRNLPFGNGISIPGTGVLLHNTMDDFAARAGRANAFGLRQGERHNIAPRARPLSSMAPTLVFRPEGHPWLALGSPGDSRITSAVLPVLLNRLVHGLNLASAVSEPRIHSPLWPDTVGFEQGLSPKSQRQRKAMGHALQPTRAMGAATAVEHLPFPWGDRQGSLGLSDPRRSAGPAVGE